MRICLIAGVSSVALAGAAILALATRTVQADVRLQRPAVSLPPAPFAGAAPATQAPAIPAAELRTHKLHGVASWYGRVFNGRKTASGDRFDMHALTACHSTLPFGSIVRVVNRVNHRSVVVRITDRGDLADEGRVIDLSYAAAKNLAMIDAGLALVDLQVLSLGRSKTAR